MVGNFGIGGAHAHVALVSLGGRAVYPDHHVVHVDLTAAV